MDYKNALQTEREKVLAQLKTVGRINPDNTADWEPVSRDLNIDTAEIEERAEEITDFEERSAIEFELEKKLNAIDGALLRIEQGTFGTCAVCNTPIDEKRLTANPSATTCRTHMEGV